MADPLSSLIRLEPAPVLPAFERFAPPPTESLIASEIETRTAPGDIIIELHGRGGWVARGAIDRLRRAFDIEGASITRLLAEVVLRPPDLRHLDAAINALAIHPRGEAGLRDALNSLYRSRCAACARDVIVDEFIWEGDADGPSRKTYRCDYCGQHARHAEHRAEPIDDDDLHRASADVDPRVRDALRRRFPAPDGHPLPDELLDLYTPRNLTAIHAILERIESELRAPPIMAGLRLALLHVRLPASRLNSFPGRMASLRIAGGRLRRPAERQWRERNVWTLFEEGWRHVRAFLQRLESAPGGTIQARLGSDLLALVEGSANVVLRTGLAPQPGNAPVLPPGAAATPARHDARSRVRLVLTQAPLRWSGENLAFAYLATSVLLGEEDAATLPLEALFGRPGRSEFGWEAAALRRSLVAVRPILAGDAAAVVILDRGGPGDLVAGVLGGVGAGYALRSALLTEVGEDMAGVLEFSPPSIGEPDGSLASPVAESTGSTGPTGRTGPIGGREI